MDIGQIWNSESKDYKKDPYSYLSNLRDNTGGIAKTVSGNWMVLSHECCNKILKSRDYNTLPLASIINTKSKILKEQKDFSQVERALEKWLLFINPPEHTKLKKVIHNGFYNIDLQRIVQEIIGETISRALKKEEINFVQVFGYEMIFRIMFEIIGADPDEDLYPDFMSLSRVMEPFNTIHDFTEINESYIKVMQFLEDLIAEKRLKPQNDLTSYLVSNGDEKDGMTESEILSSLVMILFAGIDTSANYFSNLIYMIGKNESILTNIEKHPKLLNKSIEESFRVLSIVQQTIRIPRKNVTLKGHRIPKGSIIFVSLCGANYDPLKFNNPYEFIAERSPNSHLAFGGGIHVCLGSRLIHLEARKFLTYLVENKIKVKLTCEPKWQDKVLIRSMDHLTGSFYIP